MDKHIRNEMPLLDAETRKQSFGEVALGYTQQIAVSEASRCLSCKNQPCVSGCPVNIHIPDFIKCVKDGKFEEAYNIISESSSLPAVCGRVCPQETQCESKCTLGIKFEPVAIGRLERFVADYHNENSKEEPVAPVTNGKQVAVIGAGPSGLTCAGDLAKKGYSVTVFEALHTAGGVLSYGIPEFRLPKSIVACEIERLKKYGVKIETNVVIGKTLTIDELFERGFDSVYVASGAGLPRFMGIKGETLNGVYSANEYLTRCNLMKAYEENSKTPIMKAKNIVVVGGGNVAMDAARCAVRMGANVTIVYRRSEKEIPARAEEVFHAKEEGIRFMFLTNPIEVCGDENGNVSGIICEKMTLSEPDASGRAKAISVEGSEFRIDADGVIIAIGTSPNSLISSTTEGLNITKRGGIEIDEASGQTSKQGVFAGGDAVTGSATVISAMGAGKRAAEAIDNYLRN